jgi:hypothetical protein
MNLPDLNRRLLQAARHDRPSEQVPYAFEKRVMARLTSGSARVDPWTALLRPLWCGAAACAVITLMLHLGLHPFQPDPVDECAFSNGVEETLLAPAGELDLSW